MAQDGLSPYDVARIRTVTAAAISPDGEAVAFVHTHPRDPLEGQDGPTWTELYVVDTDGRERGFVTGEVNIAGVAWTPEGGSISFLTRHSSDENRALHVISLDGGEARKVVMHSSNIAGYSWSPDGTRVAFLATEAQSQEDQALERKGFNQIVYEESTRPVRVWVTDVPEHESTSNARALSPWIGIHASLEPDRRAPRRVARADRARRRLVHA